MKTTHYFTDKDAQEIIREHKKISIHESIDIESFIIPSLLIGMFIGCIVGAILTNIS